MRFTFFSQPLLQSNPPESDRYSQSTHTIRVFCQQLSDIWFASTPTNRMMSVFYGVRGINVGTVFAALMLSHVSQVAACRMDGVFDHREFTGGLDVCEGTAVMMRYSHRENSFSHDGHNNPFRSPMGDLKNDDIYEYGEYGANSYSPNYDYFEYNVNFPEHKTLLLIQNLISQDLGNFCLISHRSCDALFRWVKNGIDPHNHLICVERPAAASGLKEPARGAFQPGLPNEESHRESQERVLFMLSAAIFLLLCRGAIVLRRHAIPLLTSVEVYGPLPTGIQRRLDAIQDTLPERIPEALCCSITGDVMVDPVRASDGFCYDFLAIKTWAEKGGSSPLTREPLQRTLFRDFDKQKAIEAWLDGVLAEQEATDSVVIEMSALPSVDESMVQYSTPRF